MAQLKFPPYLTNESSLEVTLQRLGFDRTILGFEREWGGIDFSITESFNCWFLIRAGYRTEREYSPPLEVRVLSTIKPIEFLALIYRLLADVNPDADMSDEHLAWGKKWVDYQRAIKKLIPPVPTIWADREFLRFCLTYVERQHDWAEQDYEIRFSFISGQLRINALQTEVYCPARGNWIGESLVTAKVFFRRLSKRFIGDVVEFQNHGSKLVVDGRMIPARFQEPDVHKES